VSLKSALFNRFSASLALGTIALVAIVFFSATSRSHAKAVSAAPPLAQVTVAEVISRPLREWQEFTGRLQAVDTVEVRPRVSGYVDQVAFKDGARVKKGQLLFLIDPRPFQAEVDRLVAERTRYISDLELAKANLARAERLVNAHAISREEYERTQASVTSAEGALGSNEASLQEARLNREFTEIRAPIDGHASRALITAGNLVSGASVLTTIVSDDQVYVYFDADELTYLRFAKAREARSQHASAGAAGADVFIGLQDESGYPHAAQLDFVDNQVDPGTGTIRARATLANPEGRYTPGLFARVRLVGGENQSAVLIEDRAVGTDLSKSFVLRLSPDNHIEYQLIELGPEIDGLRVVTQGLTAHDVIVIDGLQHVRPGQLVAASRVEMQGHTDSLTQVSGPAELPAHPVRLASVTTH
jgi:multidrug efflux system membrane fusion protein